MTFIWTLLPTCKLKDALKTALWWNAACHTQQWGGSFFPIQLNYAMPGPKLQYGAQAACWENYQIVTEPHQSGKLQICESMSAIRVKSSNCRSGVSHWQRIREKRLPGLFEKSTPSLFDLPVGLTWLLTPCRSWQEFSLTFYYIMSAYEDANK